ncbi:MAG: alkaline phosphatase family protein [Myxococcota bacterium]
MALLWPLLGSAAEPRLVVVLVVDQLRRDRFEADLPGGLGRLAREGRVFSQAVLDHALSETCPGHATILSGRHPGATGLPGNRFVDPLTESVRYCVEDDATDARVFGIEPDDEEGRSPRNLRVTTLGDWLKREDPGSRVFAVSAKDRSAIVLGGRHADAAYWLLRGSATGFTTSRYYRSDVPAWVSKLSDRLFEELPETWTHPPPPHTHRPDAYLYESNDYSRASPHPLSDPNRAIASTQLFPTPYLDDWTLDLASALVDTESLGRGPGTDLLAVSLSATDTVGHLYGPRSDEAYAALHQLDRSLGSFLSMLEARVGRDRLLVALTADHGVLPIPEWLEAQGRSRCPVPGGRIGARGLVFGLLWHLHRKLTWVLTLPKDWLVISGTQIGVNRETARAQGVSVERIASLTERYLEDQRGIREVWTRSELEHPGSRDPEIARLYRNSLDPERSGDLMVQPDYGCLISRYDAGTSHGSPYDYDRDVPLVFWGAGVEPGIDPRPAATVDIGPTLAHRLGIDPGVELDGHSLLP